MTYDTTQSAIHCISDQVQKQSRGSDFSFNRASVMLQRKTTDSRMTLILP